MSDKKTYRFKGGKHYAFVKGEHRLLKPGETVEMTDAVAYGVRDRFDLVEGSALDPEPETEPETEPESEPEIDLDAEAVELLAGNVEQSKAGIGRIKSDEALDAIEVAEIEGKDRSGVLKAIESRRAELSE